MSGLKRLYLTIGAMVMLMTLTPEFVFAIDPIQWPASSGGNNHWYQVISAPSGISWTDANTASTALSGDWNLVTITSASENQFVYDLVKNDLSFWRAVPPTLEGPWIGATKVGSGAGDYAWVTGEPFTYKNWRPNEPFGNGDRIGLAGAYPNPGSGWNDVPASRLEYAYIIESAIPEPATISLLVLGGFVLLQRGHSSRPQGKHTI